MRRWPTASCTRVSLPRPRRSPRRDGTAPAPWRRPKKIGLQPAPPLRPRRANTTRRSCPRALARLLNRDPARLGRPLGRLGGFLRGLRRRRLIRPELHRFETTINKVIDAWPLAARVGERCGSLAAIVGADLGSFPHPRPPSPRA